LQFKQKTSSKKKKEAWLKKLFGESSVTIKKAKFSQIKIKKIKKKTNQKNEHELNN